MNAPRKAPATRLGLAAWCSLAALVAACGGGDGDAVSAPSPAPASVSADVAVLGDLAAPAEPAASAANPLLALAGLLPPDGSASATPDFPADLLPPN